MTRLHISDSPSLLGLVSKENSMHNLLVLIRRGVSERNPLYLSID